MNGKQRRYVVATDVGGTCTDTIVFAAGEPVHIGKALSTPPDSPIGVIDSVRDCGQDDGTFADGAVRADASFRARLDRRRQHDPDPRRRRGRG